MPKRDGDLLLADILEAATKIRRYTSGMDLEQFKSDSKTTDAVVRNLEIIGEAAKNLPDSVIQAYPGIPWRQIAGLRNRIVHDYFGVDLELIWKIVVSNIPTLLEALGDEWRITSGE